jgi:hypothetical protein
VPGPFRVPGRLVELRGAGREQHGDLFGVPPGGGHADPEPGHELGGRLAFPQVGEHKQGLLPWVQPLPARPDRLAMAADDPGHEGESLARQRQRGAVEKQLEPLVLDLDFGRLPQLPAALSYPGETRRIFTRP